MTKRYWHQAKQLLLVSEYHPAPAYMKRAISEYFRTTKLNLDMYVYLNRQTA